MSKTSINALTLFLSLVFLLSGTPSGASDLALKNTEEEGLFSESNVVGGYGVFGGEYGYGDKGEFTYLNALTLLYGLRRPGISAKTSLFNVKIVPEGSEDYGVLPMELAYSPFDMTGIVYPYLFGRVETLFPISKNLRGGIGLRLNLFRFDEEPKEETGTGFRNSFAPLNIRAGYSPVDGWFLSVGLSNWFMGGEKKPESYLDEFERVQREGSPEAFAKFVEEKPASPLTEKALHGLVDSYGNSPAEKIEGLKKYLEAHPGSPHRKRLFSLLEEQYQLLLEKEKRVWLESDIIEQFSETAKQFDTQYEVLNTISERYGPSVIYRYLIEGEESVKLDSIFDAPLPEVSIDRKESGKQNGYALLRLHIQNTGTAPLYRMRGIIEASQRHLTLPLLYFGHIPPGASRSYTYYFSLPEKEKTNTLAFNIRFREAHGYTPLPLNASLDLSRSLSNHDSEETQ